MEEKLHAFWVSELHGASCQPHASVALPLDTALNTRRVGRYVDLRIGLHVVVKRKLATCLYQESNTGSPAAASHFN
jgi:hypothetical protein